MTDYFADAAEFYDEAHDPASPEMLDVLAGLAANVGDVPRAFELAIGTGRVAIPLAERGVEVVGVDLSPAMLNVLRRRGADGVTGIEGDMTTTTAYGTHGRFGVAYLVYNTIMNPRTQDDQARCFANAAAHLLPGGSFVVECMVPELWRLEPGARILPQTGEPDYRVHDEFVDMVDQQLISHHEWTDDGEVRRASTPFRYVWPSELDLMARLAGMELEARWADWDRTPFTDESRFHISIYRA